MSSTEIKADLLNATLTTNDGPLVFTLQQGAGFTYNQATNAGLTPTTHTYSFTLPTEGAVAFGSLGYDADSLSISVTGEYENGDAVSLATSRDGATVTITEVNSGDAAVALRTDRNMTFTFTFTATFGGETFTKSDTAIVHSTPHLVQQMLLVMPMAHNLLVLQHTLLM